MVFLRGDLRKLQVLLDHPKGNVNVCGAICILKVKILLHNKTNPVLGTPELS